MQLKGNKAIAAYLDVSVRTLRAKWLPPMKASGIIMEKEEVRLCTDGKRRKIYHNMTYTHMVDIWLMARGGLVSERRIEKKKEKGR